MDVKARRDYMCKERIVDIEFKITRLGILGKAYYDLAQIKLKRHRTQISIAKTQNALVHAALDTLREKDRIARKNAGDLVNLGKRSATLRVQLDHQRQQVFKRQRKLEWQITCTHSSELECAQVIDPNTPPELIIRTLEQKLVWVQLKFHDVKILLKQYEATLHPLRDEWTTYDAKLAALQSTVTIKNHQYELLINTHHDAIRARDAAKLELEELLAYVLHYGKKGIVSPELRLKILRAIKEIKSVMDVESMREMYHQYLVQEKQSSYLESIYEDMTRTLDTMRGSDDYQHRTSRRSSSKDPNYASSVIGGSMILVRRHSAVKGSVSLLQILEGTQRLVDRLQEGHLAMTDQTVGKEVLEKCKNSMIQILQALHLQLKRKNKEAVKKAEFEAKEAAHWAREEAEVARKKKAAADARRKYEERQAAREAKLQAEENERQKEREAQLEAEEIYEREQIVGALQAAPSEAIRIDDPLSLPEATAPQDAGQTSAPTGNEYLLSSYYQLAKETMEDVPAPTVIYLPSLPSDSDKHIGPLDVRRQEVTAAVGVSAVSLDGERAARAIEADDGTHGPGIAPSEVPRETLPEAGQNTGSSTSGHVAEPPDTGTIEITKVVLQDGESTLSAVRELPIDGQAQSEDSKGTLEAQSTQAVAELKAEPTREIQGESQESAGSPAEHTLSTELAPAAEHTSGIRTVGISEQVLTAEPTTESRLVSPQVALGTSGDERRQEGIAPEKPQEAATSESAMVGPPSSTTISVDGREKAADQEGEAGGEDSSIFAEPVNLPSEIVKSHSQTPGATAKDPESSSATVEIIMPSDQRVVPTEEKDTSVVPVQLMDVASTVSPDDQAQLLEIPAPSGAEIPSKREEVAEVMPSSSEGRPGIASLRISSQEGLSGDSLEQRSHDTGVRGAEVLRSSNTELQGIAGTSERRGSGVSGDETAAQTPRIVEIRLSRSPSGAPIASGMTVPPVEIVPIDESLPQRPSIGGLTSPNIPRSPSGAPMATSALFPYGSESAGQRSERSMLSDTSSPLGSSGTGGTPSETARLPTTSLEQPAPTEARLHAKSSEPEAAGTSDSPR